MFKINSFSGTLNSEFAAKQLLKIPKYVQRVGGVTIHNCHEMLLSENERGL